ncbi:hypothetical protein V1514DRAFT_317108 [Lipomyces japonicus]|uniref:uncharacterized protein n=1 Tax=Lipomyces japonicus TaxID=56871 RepID=UPI0034CE92FC
MTTQVPSDDSSKDTEPKPAKIRAVSRRACLACRERKIKCDGVHVCRNCSALAIDCVFVPSHRGGKRRRKAVFQQQPLQQPIQQHQQQLPQPHQPRHYLQAQSKVSDQFSTSPQPVQSNPAKSPTTVLETSPVLSEALTAIQNTLASLQNQINDLRADHQLTINRQQSFHTLRQSTTQPVTTALPPHSTTPLSLSSTDTISRSYQDEPSKFQFQISDSDLLAYDLPPVRIMAFLIDVFYDCFHPSYSFMLPKSFFLPSINLASDVSLLHALFAITSRLAKPSEFCSSHLGAIHPYMLDPMYWVARADKWIAYATSPIIKLKTTYLLAFAATSDDYYDRARKLLAQAWAIIDAYSLDRLDQGPDHLSYASLLPTALDRESFRRMYYLLFELHTIIAAAWNPSNLDLRQCSAYVNVPLCEPPYASGLKRLIAGQSFDHIAAVVFASDPARAAAAAAAAPVKIRLSSVFFRLAAVRVLADVAIRPYDLNPIFIADTDRKVRVLLGKLKGYKNGPSRVNMVPFVAHQLLYTTLLLLHRGQAQDRLLFVVQPAPYDNRMAKYFETPISLVRAKYANPVDGFDPSNNALATLTWAMNAVFSMVRILVDAHGHDEDEAVRRLPSFMGFTLAVCMPILASKVVMDSVQLPSIKLLLCEFDGALNDEEKQRSKLEQADPMKSAMDSRTDLDFGMRILSLIGKLWRAAGHDYNDSTALVGRMSTVM